MFRRSMGFAGSWYPRLARDCAAQIERYRQTPASGDSAAGVKGRFGVVPHAGWVFSGHLAAQVFQQLVDDEGLELVIVLGGHLRPDDPLVAMTSGEWETPFSPFVIHGGFRGELESLGCQVVLETESRNTPDNSTELQLPFARYRYPRAELLPIRVPPGPVALELGRRLAAYLKASGLRAVAVASTDLTHYGPNYGFEPKGRGEAALRWVMETNDAAFIRAVERGDGREILEEARRHHNACSSGAVAALNEMARADDSRFHAIAHTTSAEAGPGDRENFVGYLGGVYV